MVLFVSDMHFGRFGDANERASESALVACLRAHQDVVERLYLLGDVFDQYIEYRHLAPKGFVRFQGLLAEWSDRGIPITYVLGNHDPWHRSYFRDEFGVHLVADDCLEPLYGLNVYMRHGDGVDPHAVLYRALRPVLRHPMPVWLYRSLLPGDLGMALARWVKRHVGHEEVKPETVAALREYASRILRETTAGAVVMGHTHFPELLHLPEGVT